MLRFPFKEIPSYMCVKAHVCMRECLNACVHAPGAGGGGVCAGAFPVADALQADWPPNRIICCGLTPH